MTDIIETSASELPAPEEVSEPTLHMQPDGKLVLQWPAERQNMYPVSDTLISEFVATHNAFITVRSLLEQLVSNFVAIAGGLPQGVTPEMVAKDSIVLYEKSRRTP